MRRQRSPSPTTTTSSCVTMVNNNSCSQQQVFSFFGELHHQSTTSSAAVSSGGKTSTASLYLERKLNSSSSTRRSIGSSTDSSVLPTAVCTANNQNNKNSTKALINNNNNNSLSVTPPSTRLPSASKSSSPSSSSSLLLHPITEMTETFSNPRFLAEGGYGRVVSAVDETTNKNVAIKIMNFTCSTEDAKRLQGLSAFGDLANLLPGQDYIPSYLAGELRAHDALRDVEGAMPLLRVETFCDESTITTKRNVMYNYDEEVMECYVMLVLPMLSPLNTRSFYNNNNMKKPLSSSLMKTSKDLAHTLLDMHSRGWLHRDLSVTNTFIDSQTQNAFIGDFGLAVCSNGRCSTASKFFAMETNYCTTIWYRSPEIVQNPDLPYTFSNDCWSLGAVIAELMFGRPLFPGMDRDSQLQEMKTNLGATGEKAQEFWSSLVVMNSRSCDSDHQHQQQQQLFKHVCDHLLNFDPAKRSVQKFLEALEKQ